MLYLTNAFSLNMLDGNSAQQLSVTPIGINTAKAILSSSQFINAIGHPDTDAVVRNDLGLDESSKGNRITVSMEAGDCLVVAQYRGPRLEEGATSLPEGAAISYSSVVIN